MRKTSKNKITAFYPGSFDPFTLGHLDIVERTSMLFDQVVVGVGTSSKKNALFTPAERVSMIEKSCAHLTNVKVSAFNSLTVDFANKVKASVIIRGIRNELDYQYEMQMVYTNKKLAPKIDVLFFPTRPELCYISSTYIKEIASFGGKLADFIPKKIIGDIIKKFK